MTLLCLACLLAALGSGFGAGTAAAAVCASHATQQAAQDAKDTFDADGDGIYCETLPCPCSPEWNAQHGGGNSDAPNVKSKKTYVYSGRVTRVVDGDTLHVKVKKKTKKVRVLGIDTPELGVPPVAPECGAAEAKSAAFKWAFRKPLDTDRDGLFDRGREGREVRLRTDNTQTKTDKYGRLLAYVSRGANDFGKSQIALGWAELFVYLDNPFKRVESYRLKLDQARADSRGAWSLCGGNFHLSR